MNITTDIALRYLRSGRQGYVSFITWVSLVGLLLGVLVLTVVVSVMNGFDHELKTRLLRAIPHLIVESVGEVPREMTMDPAVTAAFPYFEATGMVSRGNSVQPVSVIALDEAGVAAFDEVREHLQSGSLESLLGEHSQIVLGEPLADHLGLLPGDKLTVTLLSAAAGRIRPVTKTFRLGGTFQLDAEPDYALALIGLTHVPPVVRDKGGEHGVQLRLSQPLEAQKIADQMRTDFPQFVFSPWTERYGDLFSAVKIEKVMMFVLLLLVVAVAAFNIVSGQIMLIREKSPAIAILRTMGATASQVERIFLVQGALIAMGGITLGLGLGVWAAMNIDALVAGLESLAGVRFLEGTYFVQIPVVIELSDLAIIAALSSVICLFAAWIPARKARQVHPVQGLHGG
jgi:lipoprotein-releasing system permease protein